MKSDKSTKAILAVVVVLLVCAGTYLGARSLTKREAGRVTETTTQAPILTSPYATMPTTTQPIINTTAPTTLPTSSSYPTIITTYPVPSTQPTTTQPTTTQPTTTQPTTTQPTTVRPTTTKPVAPTDENVKRASLFSEGFLSYLFNPEGNYYYTNTDPWQRALGFNEIYDAAAGFVVIYIDTVRIKFPYADKDWMVQFWKGQYGWIFIGAEIGVYTKPTSRTIEHYDAASDEDALGMSMTCLRKGEEIFTRDYAKYWWCTGFVPGKLDSFADRSELSVQARLTMKDKDMLNAFTKGCDKAGFVYNTNYTVDGLDVYIKW